MQAGYETVYGLVKKARLAKPVDTKALDEIRNTYGDDLYKEALEAVLAKLENYEFVIEEYVAGSSLRDMRLVEKDETRFVLDCEGRKAVVDFDPQWEEYVYTVNGKGPFAHRSYELIAGDIWQVLEASKKSLAARLNDFYKDFDPYDYMDNLNGTEEDAVMGLEGQLEDAGAVSGILDALADIQENGALSEEQAAVVSRLIEDVSALRLSVDELLCDAQERIAPHKTGNEKEMDLGI